MENPTNLVALLLAALANMAVGMVWYGPLFGKTWMGLMGMTPDSMKTMPLTAKQAIFGGFITSLIMSYVLAHFAYLSGVENFWGGLQLAFWVWLGFVATTSVSSFLWEGKPFKLFVLNAVEELIALSLMVAVLLCF
ncbi:DUF1761 domain-containing protein [Candidatus Nomurabacteria bacterium]|nr:DUF1761 domain-containing protein [Candidatus Nomurabacteria bacterium]